MRVRGSYGAQYDQAGAMVRLDERRWLKTGAEYFDGRPRTPPNSHDRLCARG
jgi:regulation of enolase protein 1 (concanavalin A-like superfamily)